MTATTEPATHRDRLERLCLALDAAGVEALWVEPSVSLSYLTGLDPVSVERLFGLIVRPDDDLRLVVPELLAEESKELPGEAELFVWDDARGPHQATAAALDGIDRLVIQGSLPSWSWALLRAARPGIEVDIDDELLGRLRELKDATEVDALRRSGAVTDEIVAWVGTLELGGLTEAQLAGRIQARYLELGHRPSPHGLIASGANAAMPHYVAGADPIATEALLLMDIGCAVEGYWSDITRIYFPRPLEGELASCYEIVCAAYDAAFAAARPGVACKEVDAAARTVIADAGYGDHFIHRTGHGLGLEVHEPPWITGTNERPLEVGHVFSIEPGIYLPGRFGVRYENIVHLGENGPESMNHSAREHFFG
ncbi:MAG: M24 family metallopeptidase [Actinomycetota bacterium]